MNIWRLQTKTDSKSGKKTADYCIENNILAIGWSLKDSHLPQNDKLHQMIQERNLIKTIDDYHAFINKYNIYGGKIDSNVKRFNYEILANDLVWIRSNGIYYLGRVTEESHWKFDNSPTAMDLDIANQITNIEWHRIGDESDVPGSITTSFIRGKTLQKIWKTGVSEYSKTLYNAKTGTNFYTNFELSENPDTFYSLLSPDDCEDLLCLWLYSKFGYITIPSTNKKSTECYECVLKDPDTGKNIYPQVKSGSVILYEKDYMHLPGEVWLFTTNGHVVVDDSNIHDNIHIADPIEIYNFVGTDIASKILPQSILSWYKKLHN